MLTPSDLLFLLSLTGGGYAEYVSVPHQQLIHIPNGMNFVDAAAIPEVWLTAFQLLHKVAAIKPNDRVLIHAAGSGVGTAAIQLVKNIPGTQIIATAGSFSFSSFFFYCYFEWPMMTNKKQSPRPINEISIRRGEG